MSSLTQTPPRPAALSARRPRVGFGATAVPPSKAASGRNLFRPGTFSAILLGLGLCALLALYGVGPAQRFLEDRSSGARAAQHAVAIEAVMATDPIHQRRQDMTERARRFAGAKVDAGFFIRTPTPEKLACITFRGGDMHAPEPYLVRMNLDSLRRMLAVQDEMDFATYWALYKRCRIHANMATSVN
ncbi:MULTISPECIES: hypothetical protein [Rhodovulum]|uniref:Uncharacterized protein n=2 Tax=Rhodovulum TaxID=34008 RepID=A0A8E2VHM6_9RHOB|nr:MULTISPECIES: hypothetical protein [Rhodovulum]PTW46115.1 hypothetical protein C8N38_11273 [Rhodovulum kholense]RAP40869.1 hypothetical protein BYZ73_12920 [Rhodovulum viride]